MRAMKLDLESSPIRAECPATRQWWLSLYRALGEGHVAGFGGALKSWGFPFGVALAWGITLFEIAAATALLAGRLVIPASIGLALELAAGIALVHAKEGWFVVGGGRNGMEYSVLLITGFLALVVSERSRRMRN